MKLPPHSYMIYHLSSHLKQPPNKFFAHKSCPLYEKLLWKTFSHTLGESTMYNYYFVTIFHNSKKISENWYLIILFNVDISNSTN